MMKIEISMSTRDKSAFAYGIYTDGKVIVKTGGKINPVFRGLEKIKKIRQDKGFVDENYCIIKDCEFASPSEAAQFVNGNISNGYRVWKVSGKNLGDYLKEVGLK